MEYFLKMTRAPTELGMFFDVTPSYLAFTVNSEIGPGLFGVCDIYMLPAAPNAYVALACLGHRIDSILPAITHPRDGKSHIRKFSAVWPIFGQLLANSLNERYGDCALLYLRDPDDFENKWFVGSVIGNLAGDTIESLMSGGQKLRIMSAFDAIVDAGQRLEEELSRGLTLSEKLTMMKTNAVQDFLAGARDGLIWEAKVLKALHGIGYDLGGSGS